MTERPERRASGPRSARHPGAAGDLDLSSHDWRGVIEQLPLAVSIDRLDEWSSNLYTSPQIEAILGSSTEDWAAEKGSASAGTLTGVAELVPRVDAEFARAAEALRTAIQEVA
jgi:hypothetical protein